MVDDKQAAAMLRPPPGPGSAPDDTAAVLEPRVDDVMAAVNQLNPTHRRCTWAKLCQWKNLSEQTVTKNHQVCRPIENLTTVKYFSNIAQDEGDKITIEPRHFLTKWAKKQTDSDRLKK